MYFYVVTLAGLGLSWINKYDTKTASRWRQFPVCIRDSLNHSFKRFIQNSGFIWKWSRWPSIWMDDSFKRADSSYCLYEWMIDSKGVKKQINSGIKQHGVSFRCTNVLLQLCLELFSSVKQKKQTLLCLKCNSIDINILFVELLSKMITFANALMQIFRKTALLLVWYYINVISYKNKNTTAHTGIFVAFIEAF